MSERNGDERERLRIRLERERKRRAEAERIAEATTRDLYTRQLQLEEARDQIRAGVEKALRNLDDYKPYKLSAPYTLVLTLKTEQSIYEGSFYPGAKRTGDWELTYVADDVMEAMAAYRGMRR